MWSATDEGATDPLRQAGNVPLSDEFRDQLAQAYGLDQSVWHRYVIYIGKVMTGDLGESYATNREPVLGLILDRAGWWRCTGTE